MAIANRKAIHSAFSHFLGLVLSAYNKSSPDKNNGIPSEHSQRIIRKSILEVKPSDSCILKGYLDMRAANRKPWEKRYFALHQDFVLYTFKAEDVSFFQTFSKNRFLLCFFFIFRMPRRGPRCRSQDAKSHWSIKDKIRRLAAKI